MWIAAVALSGLVALVFAANGMAKLLGHPKMIEASTHLGYSMRSFRSVSPPRPASSSSRSGDLSPIYARRIRFVWPRPRSDAHY